MAGGFDQPTTDDVVDVFELSERMWNGGDWSGRDVWSRDFPIAQIGENVVGERFGFILSMANTVVVETQEGLVLIDTGSFMVAEQTHKKVVGWSSLPIHTAIFTHGHYDHVFGIGEYEKTNLDRNKTKETNRVRVVAQENVPHRFDRYKRTIGYNTLINARQFSSSSEMAIELPTNFRYPDELVRKQKTLNIGNEVFELFHFRGETDDALWVWLPNRKVICTGDFFIWHVPNAGNPQKQQRYAHDWSVALRKMETLEAEVLCPGHGVPIIGRERVREALRNTAEYLESLVEQTIQLLNKGASLDKILHQVQPPAHLSNKPYLQPTYDEPQFIVRNIYRLYAGWYDGSPANLLPAPNHDLSLELIGLIGGEQKLIDRANQLIEQGKFALATHLVQIAYDGYPQSIAVAECYQKVLRERADHPTTTSLMAKGIFRAAASSVHVPSKSEPVNSSIFDPIWRFLGLSSGSGTNEQDTAVLDTVSMSEIDLSIVDLEKSKPVHSLAERYNDETQKAIQVLEEMVQQPDEKWTQLAEKEGVVTYSQTIDGKHTAMKGIGSIDVPIEVIDAFLLNKKYKHMWEGTIAQQTVLVQLKPFVVIRHTLIPGRLMIASRDIVSLSVREERNGKYLYAVRSVDFDDMPPQDGVVRMDLMGGGLVVERDTVNPNRSLVTFVYMADVKGSLPQSITDMVGIRQTRVISRIRDAITQ